MTTNDHPAANAEHAGGIIPRDPGTGTAWDAIDTTCQVAGAWAPRADWGTIAAFADIERARRVAVRLEQELAVAERRLEWISVVCLPGVRSERDVRVDLQLVADIIDATPEEVTAATFGRFMVDTFTARAEAVAASTSPVEAQTTRTLWQRFLEFFGLFD